MIRPKPHPAAGRPSLVALGSMLLVAGCGEAGFEGPSPVHFVEVAAEAGLDFDHDQGKTEELYQIESLVAAAIFFDADDDGDQDLYMLNGCKLTEPIGDDTPVNTYYENDGTGHYSDATASSGLGDPRYSSGVSGADYDNDGDVDLYVTNFATPNALFENDGTARFTDRAVEAGVVGTRPNDASSGWADLDVDGWLDLYVCNYNDHSLDNHFRCEQPRRDGKGKARRYCTVERYPPVDDILYRNLGDGTFEDVTASSGIAEHPARSFGVSFADYDEDGDTDFFVASDRSPNLLFENLGGMKFREIGHAAGIAVTRDGKARAGMGICAGDLDFDGDFDVAVTYFEREFNGFYENRGGNRFTAWETTNGTGRPSYDYVGWGIEFFDADLDTDLDVLAVHGHFLDNTELFREPIADYEQPNLLYLNDGTGDFQLVNGHAGPGIDLLGPSRGLAVADYDNDGDLDALVLNLDRRPHLLRNDSPRNGNHWLMVETVGTQSNRDGVGARVTVHLEDRVLVREVRTAQTYLGQGDMRQHFGLGPRTVVPRLEVRWPSGAHTVLEDVGVDQVLTVVEPEE